MKRMKFWILGMILLSIYSCSDELESVDRSFNDAGITEAQSYFEANATDLAPLTFPIPSLGRSADATIVPELIPEWDKAIETENEDYLIKEVPIRSQSGIICVERVIKDAEFYRENRTRCQRRLVIAYPKEGEEKPDMFLATLVPDKESARNTEDAFTGRVFYSELNGKFRKAVSYKNGKEDKELLIGEAYGFAIQTEENVPLGYSKLTFQEENSASLSATYSSSESGGGSGGGWIGGGSGGIGGGSGTGTGTGTGTGGSSGGSGNDSDYAFGLECVKKMRTDTENKNFIATEVKRNYTTGEAILTTTSIATNWNGIITECLNFMNPTNVDKIAKTFGSVLGKTNLALGTAQTIIAIATGDYSPSAIMNATSTALAWAGVIFALTPVTLGVIGVTGCVLGIVSSFISLSKTLLIKVPMEDGGSIYICISPNANIMA